MNLQAKNQVNLPKKFGAMHLMRNFCRDYSRKNSNTEQGMPALCKYQRKKTDSADKMSKFLYNMEYSSINPTPRHKSYGISSVKASQNTAEEGKRCYFKNSYCQSHPFLTTQHKITPQRDGIKEDHTSRVQAKRKMTEPASGTIFNDFCKFTTESNTLASPQKNRELVRDLKQKIEKAKEIKREKMKRIKYNYLVSNCYKSHLKTDNSEPVTRAVRQNFANTKDNIFPPSIAAKIKTETIAEKMSKQ